MNTLPESFEGYECGANHKFWVGKLPLALALSEVGFDQLWHLHPQDYHEIMIHGRLVKTPRWQQAYGVDYHYTGRVNAALPIPALILPIISWAKETIDDRLNGVLLNWYDGELGHYIGAHRDSTKNMIEGVPIVTISFGAERVFRIRPWPHVRGGQRFDFAALNGSVFVMPFEMNLAFTHEVLASGNGKRISVTLRGLLPSLAASKQ